MRLPPNTERGFSLITFAILLPAMIAGTGISVDLGRIYVTKTELQQYADAAAIDAAFELDGTSAGITDAYNKAIVGPGTTATRNRWNFDTSNVTLGAVEFSQLPTGGWNANPSPAANYRFVRVVATANIPIYFLRILPGTSSTQTVDATAIAGQGLENQLGPGMAPFSPDAQNRADPNFGYSIGQEYTLKWAPPGLRMPNNRCAGDRTFLPGGGDNDRGYINIGQGDGQWGLYDSIVNGGVYSLGHSLYAYNQLTVAVSNAARFAGRDGLGSSTSQFADRIKNVAVYGNPEGTGNAMLTGLQTSNVNVAIEQDSAGVPRNVTVGIQNYTIDGVFWTTSLINKPYATARYAGRYQPYGS